MVIEWPVLPMIARSAPVVPAGDRFSYEPKFDGYRCIALCERGGRVRLQSRQQRPLPAAFPDVLEALAAKLPVGTVVDGELVVMSGGRLAFDALQRRLTSREVEPAAPATLVVFDLLTERDEDTRPRPYEERRRRLTELIESSGTGLALMPACCELGGAHAWIRDAGNGIEGVVAKRVDHGYLPRHRFWWKTKAKTSCEAVVGGVMGSPDRPRSLILGRYDRRGRLRVIGRTFPLRQAASEAVGAMLAPPTGPHPWPTVLPSSRFGLAGSKPVAHTPVAPTLVVEIEADTSYEAGRYRHGVRFMRIRAELHPFDLVPHSSDGWSSRP